MFNELARYKLTYIIIAINILVYIISSFYSHSLIDMNLQVLVDMGASYGPLTVQKQEWWRLFTAMFLHAGITHIAMNMYSLYLVGRSAEMYFNTKSYISIYLFSGIIGGLISLYIHPASVGIGASGAIFGIFGALAGFFLANRDKIANHTKAFMKNFTSVLGINLVIGLLIPSIDVSAHIGGLVIGIIGGFVLAKNPKAIVPFNIVMVLISVAIALYLPLQYAQRLF